MSPSSPVLSPASGGRDAQVFQEGENLFEYPISNKEYPAEQVLDILPWTLDIPCWILGVELIFSQTSGGPGRRAGLIMHIETLWLYMAHPQRFMPRLFVAEVGPTSASSENACGVRQLTPPHSEKRAFKTLICACALPGFAPQHLVLFDEVTG